MASLIEDYALIGDGESAALVSRAGSVDWLCWPRFDSGACFAALLGKSEHGCWRIAPSMAGEVSRRYRNDSLILETTFATAEGEVRVTDFMPMRGQASDLVRIVTGLSGRVRMRCEFLVRFDFGSIEPWVVLNGAEPPALAAIAGPDRVTMHTSIELHREGPRVVGEFEIEAGESVDFVLTYSPSHQPPPARVDAVDALSVTERYWAEWSGRCRFAGEWREAVMRSLITLKALIYRPTGGIVAAVTTSLPENPGGERNWDYRFCWLRDATFTLLALMDAGYIDEARDWRDWLVRALAGQPAQAQIMYGLAGERRLTEWNVEWLPGYEGSRPVRIGNAAALQTQLDIYGEVADALHHAREGGLAPVEAAWAVQVALTGHVEEIWSAKDEGIWEVRGPRRHFTHSKVMAWVAIDRAIKAMEKHGLAGPVDRWRELRGKIHADVCAHGYNAKLKTFVQAYGGREPDASLLMLPLVGFLPATDERVRGTVDAIGRILVKDGFVRRYRTEAMRDGLRGTEGCFLACSFWYVDNLALVGRTAEARELFRHLLRCRNDVGLMAEEYDPAARRQLGNFPQAFSHVALVSSAYNLEEREPGKPARQRSKE